MKVNKVSGQDGFSYWDNSQGVNVFRKPLLGKLVTSTPGNFKGFKEESVNVRILFSPEQLPCPWMKVVVIEPFRAPYFSSTTLSLSRS